MEVATSLIDSGRTYTFMTPDLAKKISCPTVATKQLKVQVTNGGTLWTEFMCNSCSYIIQGETFSDSFRILHLKGYDIILGNDWLKKNIPVEMNFITMSMRITDADGRHIIFQDETLPSSVPAPETPNFTKIVDNSDCGALIFVSPVQENIKDTKPICPPPVQKLLNEFEELFQEPTKIPPVRFCDHAIPLVPDAKIINQRAYRLSHHQKDALEGLVKHMLMKHIIQHNSSPYSSLVILVRKKDETWRLCNDFRKLNAMTIKKYVSSSGY